MSCDGNFCVQCKHSIERLEGFRSASCIIRKEFKNNGIWYYVLDCANPLNISTFVNCVTGEETQSYIESNIDDIRLHTCKGNWFVQKVVPKIVIDMAENGVVIEHMKSFYNTKKVFDESSVEDALSYLYEKMFPNKFTYGDYIIIKNSENQ